MRVWLVCLCMLAGEQAWAQSSACNADEDVVTFNFGTTTATGPTGGTATWPDASVGPITVRVGTSTGAVNANSITFRASIDAGVAWSQPGGAGANAPRLALYGNAANSLALAMDATTPSIGTHLTLTFSRPMNKVQFLMSDVDYQAGSWQDVLRVTGYLNGNPATAPTFTAVTPAYYTVASPAAGTTEATALASAPNCAATNAACNITIGFSAPIDALRIDFLSGASIATPVSQVVGFQNFSYCVPKRDLALVKTALTPTFVAGATASYALAISNRGGAPTSASPLLVRDILPAGVTFANPQLPGDGWSCVIGTTNVAGDTADCSRTTPALGANGASTVLTLTVAISPSLTATSVVNRAKVAGGGDPNKPAILSTGPVTACNASNEGWPGGGATDASGATTNTGCGFEAVPVVRQALLSVSKSNGTSSVVSGANTTYTITVANAGPSDAPGTVVLDPVAPGLNCAVPTFSATPSNAVATSPTALTLSAWQTTGVMLTPTFNANSTATFTLTCQVTASGA